jgi:Flp pilus assembly protein TadG
VKPLQVKEFNVMHSRRIPRRGATVVEITLVLVVCFMLLFGVLEYSRYLYALQIADNAAREGARFAVVSASSADLATNTQNVQNLVASKVGGLNGTLLGYQCNVSARVMYAHDGLTAGTTLTDWTTAGPNDSITVSITGNFVPVTPTLLFFGNTLPVQASSTMYSEGN